MPLNIGDNSIDLDDSMQTSTPIIVVAGSCMNSGKTVAAVELIRQAANAGLKVAGVKLTGIACLRDTLNMQDHGAFVTASFLDCGLPSTVDCENLSSVAKSIFNHIDSLEPNAISSLVFCASDYVGVVGGVTTLKSMGIEIDVVAGSVTDSQMGEDFVRTNFGLEAGNARRDGKRLFELVGKKLKSEAVAA